MSTSKGYKWLTNGINTIYVKENEINKYLNLGYSFGMDIKYREKISKSLKGIPSGKCKDPQKELERKQKIFNSMKGNTNWKFNKHHGNSKQGWYKGIHCDSTWELAYLVYHIENNLYIERCKQYFDFIWENGHHKYIPDFITNEGIIEIKGRKSKKSLEKEKQFPNIKVIDEHTIKPYLEYVKHKYGDKFWINLYEDYSKDYQDKQYLTKVNRKIQKEKNKLERTNILKNACKNSNINFTKFGWSTKMVKYLKNRNELFDKMILRAFKIYYPDFFNIYKPYIRAGARVIETTDLQNLDYTSWV